MIEIKLQTKAETLDTAALELYRMIGAIRSCRMVELAHIEEVREKIRGEQSVGSKVYMELSECEMENIEQLAISFRKAIELASEAGEFENDMMYRRFPRACCGDTCNMLAQYLLDKDIRTEYVCGTYLGETYEDRQSHAWLMLEKHVIIDITGDQFRDSSIFLNYDKAVYVGEEDDFHRLFEVEDRDIRENKGLRVLGSFCTPRLWSLYRKILKYI